jgi:hypothetical protein
MKNIAAPRAGQQHRLAKVGLRDQQRRHRAEQDHRDQAAGNFGPPLDVRQTARRTG